MKRRRWFSSRNFGVQILANTGLHVVPISETIGSMGVTIMPVIPVYQAVRCEIVAPLFTKRSSDRNKIVVAWRDPWSFIFHFLKNESRTAINLTIFWHL